MVKHKDTECIEKFIDSVHSASLCLNKFARLLLPSTADVETDFDP